MPAARKVRLDRLTPHPRNYRTHPPEQVDHLAQSILDHGVYRAIVAAEDFTVLAGHGIRLAALQLGLATFPVVKLPIAADSAQALKLLAADNYLSYFTDDDDRALTDLLLDVKDNGGLHGTGFDDQQLAALLMVTRPAAELATFDAAAEWVGMPEYEPNTKQPQLVLWFDDEAGRAEVVEQLGVFVNNRQRTSWSAWWPPREKDDVGSVKFEG
jgi:hypothetical protein